MSEVSLWHVQSHIAGENSINTFPMLNQVNSYTLNKHMMW